MVQLKFFELLPLDTSEQAWDYGENYLRDRVVRKVEGRNNYFASTGMTRPGLQAGACWVERKGYIRGSVARGSHLGL